MNSCCIYTGVCGVECSGKDTEVDINSCKVAREIDKLIDRIQKLKREKEKYYQMTLDDEIQINELFRENAKLKEALEEIRKLNSSCADCDCYNTCGVCSNAEEKPYRSFKIADEVLKDEH